MLAGSIIYSAGKEIMIWRSAEQRDLIWGDKGNDTLLGDDCN
jgi:hypothetical protein